MPFIRLKSLQVFNSAVTQNINRIYCSISNWPVFRDILPNNHTSVKKNYIKTESVAKCQKANPTVETSTDKLDFSDKLIKWAMQNNISFISFSKLLKILSDYGIENLPKSSRTLLKAKEEEIKVSPVPPGTYTHFGLRNNLTNLISNLVSKNLLNKTDVDVSIFIDHLPLIKFTQKGLWVILGSVRGFTNNIFFVGAYQGYSKPKDSNLFLSEFVTETKHLCSKGLEINGVKYNIKIKTLICDAPAKAFILNIKYFKGYSSCTKCNTVGENKGRTIDFSEKSTSKIDEDFEKSDIYQKGKTVLLEIPHFGVVSNVTLDYMHLVCLGVVKKLFSIWLTHDSHWICEDSATDMIKALAPLYPSEFQKKPKSFKIFRRWTGNEFRQFLLYHGPVVLKDSLKKEHFDNFLRLHVACRLLCIDTSPENIDCCRKLLSSFVENYQKLYKDQQVTHNFHGLYHLADECASHGTLDSFSAFPFERFLLQVRNSMKKSRKMSVPNTILKESYYTVFNKSLAKLTQSEYKIGKKLKISETNQFENFSQCEKLWMKNFEIIPGTMGDKYVRLKNNKIIEVLSVLEKKEKSKKTHLIAGREFSSVSNFYSEPFERLKLNVYTVGNVSDGIEMWPIEMIDKKCMKIPGNKETVMFCLLDENF